MYVCHLEWLHGLTELSQCSITYQLTGEFIYLNPGLLLGGRQSESNESIIDLYCLVNPQVTQAPSAAPLTRRLSGFQWRRLDLASHSVISLFSVIAFPAVNLHWWGICFPSWYWWVNLIMIKVSTEPGRMVLWFWNRAIILLGEDAENECFYYQHFIFIIIFGIFSSF